MARTPNPTTPMSPGNLRNLTLLAHQARSLSLSITQCHSERTVTPEAIRSEVEMAVAAELDALAQMALCPESEREQLL